jgi:hypothetical protein
MQLTVADPAVDRIDLVLAAWSDAQPATCASVDSDATEAEVDRLVAQLSLRLDDTQIPLWDERA